MEKIHGATADAELYTTKCAFVLAHWYGVVVQAVADPARTEKDHLKLLACAYLYAQSRCSKRQKQGHHELTAAALQHLFSDSLSMVHLGTWQTTLESLLNL